MNSNTEEQNKSVEENATNSNGNSADNNNKPQSATPLNQREKMPLWIYILIFLGTFMISALLGGMVGSVIAVAKGVVPTEITGSTLLWVYLVQMIPPVVVLWFLRKRMGVKERLLFFNPKVVNAPLVLWGILFIMATSVVLEPLLALFPESYLERLNGMIGTGGWAIATTVVCAPIMEEILFRGEILGAVRSRVGAFWAVVISAALFGLIHGIPQQVINAFFIGLILGYIYIRTRSLTAVIILHAVNNGLAYISTTVFESNQTLSEAIPNRTLYYIIYGVSVAFFIFAMVKLVITLHNSRELD